MQLSFLVKHLNQHNFLTPSDNPTENQSHSESAQTQESAAQKKAKGTFEVFDFFHTNSRQVSEKVIGGIWCGGAVTVLRCIQEIVW